MAVRSLNKATIIGNLTRDPELKYTASGTPLAIFGVATNREYSPSNRDEVVEEVEFHNVVAWAKLAELCDQLLSKGQKVYVEGRLNTRNWQDQETGKKMYRTEIVAEEMIVLSFSDRGRDSSPSSQPEGKESAKAIGSGGGEKSGGEEGDIPF